MDPNPDNDFESDDQDEIRRLRRVVDSQARQIHALYNMTGTTFRPALSKFAIEMEVKLKRNDHKTGWRDLPVEALLRQAMLEIEEFKVALEFLPVEEARKESVDVANFFMILHDRLSLLDQTKPYGAQK